MINPQSVLIWSGRDQLGDEPGIYGDAGYVGITLELPITLKPFPGNPATPRPTPQVTLVLTASDVNVYAGYPGHELSVLAYTPVNPSDPLSKWKETPVQLGQGEGRLTKDGETRLTLQKLAADVKFVSLRIRVDTTVAAGLYDDFLITRLGYESTTHYAMVGFRE